MPDKMNPFDPKILESRGLITSGHNLPYDPGLVQKARELRKNLTYAEKKLWYDFFRQQKFRVLRQRPIDHFIVDFYIPTYKLVIEIDGDSHYEDSALHYDRQRTEILGQYGLFVLRFTNNDVIQGFDSVCEAILEKCENLSNILRKDE